ncbi:hypothetical protein V1477_010916 [Vespula maculifrons]|uniref:Uncharacterized protein n=1 Tax=Vespula maculifrons TaxID=7453 RepID=A0ABD2C3B0_VESMC
MHFDCVLAIIFSLSNVLRSPIDEILVIYEFSLFFIIISLDKEHNKGSIIFGGKYDDEAELEPEEEFNIFKCLRFIVISEMISSPIFILRRNRLLLFVRFVKLLRMSFIESLSNRCAIFRDITTAEI